MACHFLQEWFGNPVNDMVEGLKMTTKEQDRKNQERIARLHKVWQFSTVFWNLKTFSQLLRPFLLRRLKKDVEKQMPNKYEHVLTCHLSKRQRLLYDEFMSRTKTKETLATGNYMSIINILMQLRKVCNHPNLFAEPDIASPLLLPALAIAMPALVVRDFETTPQATLLDSSLLAPDAVSLSFLNLCLLHAEVTDASHVDVGVAARIAEQIQALSLPVGAEQIRGIPDSPRYS